MRAPAHTSLTFSQEDVHFKQHQPRGFFCMAKLPSLWFTLQWFSWSWCSHGDTNVFLSPPLEHIRNSQTPPRKTLFPNPKALHPNFSHTPTLHLCRTLFPLFQCHFSLTTAKLLSPMWVSGRCFPPRDPSFPQGCSKAQQQGWFLISPESHLSLLEPSPDLL